MDMTIWQSSRQIIFVAAISRLPERGEQFEKTPSTVQPPTINMTILIISKSTDNFNGTGMEASDA